MNNTETLGANESFEEFNEAIYYIFVYYNLINIYA